MRKLLLAAALGAAAIPAVAGEGSARPAPADAGAASCAGPAPSPAAAAPGASEAAALPPVLVEGLGYAGLAPDTQDAEARRWFEQGVRLVWAYDEAEAVRSFQQAEKLDPRCALCFWGEGWARSPTLNLGPRTEEHPAAAAAAARARALSAASSERDRGLIAALTTRVGTGAKFENRRYMRAIQKLAERFPDDDAVLVIAADATMVGAKNAKEGAVAQRLLETVLRRNPDHSGAIHFYIHLTDFINGQKLAEPYANRLGKLAPAAAHLVHMPSHTFYGVGRYREAAAVNVAALAAEKAYAERVKPPVSDYRNGLAAHNSNFAIESALMRGDAKTALQVAETFAARFPAPSQGGRPVARASTWYAWGLHEDPARVLAMPEPAAGEALMRAMRRYARGEALARQGNAAGVRAEAAALSAFLKGPDSRALGSPAVEALVGVARALLTGRAAMLDGRFKEAETAYRQAMALQAGAKFGMDPPPFWYGTRRSVGAALLAAGDAAGARLQFAQLLRDWPNDALALLGLARAEKALGEAEPAAAHLARARKLWVGDVEAMPLARI